MLKAIVRTGTITHAAASAKISRRTHSNWVKTDPLYAAAVLDATEMLADRLEREAIERGTIGMYSLKLHQGEPVMVKRWVADPLSRSLAVDGDPDDLIPLYENTRSDTLLIFMLKGARPEKYRERVDHQAKLTLNTNDDNDVAPDWFRLGAPDPQTSGN